MKQKLFMVVLILMLSVSASSAQDTSKIGVAKNEQWTFKLVQDTTGTYSISEDGDGAVAPGETYTFTITSDISSSGDYDFEYDNGDVTAQGDGNLGAFGMDAVFTDWDYWEANIDITDLFIGFSSVAVTTSGDVFKAEGSLYGFTILIEYYMSTGVLKHILVNTGTGVMETENVTGAQGEEVPFEPIYMVFGLSLLAMVYRRSKN